MYIFQLLVESGIVSGVCVSEHVFKLGVQFSEHRLTVVPDAAQRRAGITRGVCRLTRS